MLTEADVLVGFILGRLQLIKAQITESLEDLMEENRVPTREQLMLGGGYFKELDPLSVYIEELEGIWERTK